MLLSLSIYLFISLSIYLKKTRKKSTYCWYLRRVYSILTGNVMPWPINRRNSILYKVNTFRQELFNQVLLAWALSFFILPICLSIYPSAIYTSISIPPSIYRSAICLFNRNLSICPPSIYRSAIYLFNRNLSICPLSIYQSSIYLSIYPLSTYLSIYILLYVCMKDYIYNCICPVINQSSYYIISGVNTSAGVYTK